MLSSATGRLNITTLHWPSTHLHTGNRKVFHTVLFGCVCVCVCETGHDLTAGFLYHRFLRSASYVLWHASHTDNVWQLWTGRKRGRPLPGCVYEVGCLAGIKETGRGLTRMARPVVHLNEEEGAGKERKRVGRKHEVKGMYVITEARSSVDSRCVRMS